MHTESELWRAQLENWPDSERLTMRYMLEWVDAARTINGRYSRALQLASSLQHMAPVVFYRCCLDEPYPGMGARYGLEPSQYISFYSME